MSRMSELSLAVTELRRCGEALIGISESLADLFSGGDKNEAVTQPKVENPAPEPKPAVKAVTLEQVRALLAEKSHDGFTAEVRTLLEKHGAKRLSEIDPANYPALLADAEGLK